MLKHNVTCPYCGEQKRVSLEHAALDSWWGIALVLCIVADLGFMHSLQADSLLFWLAGILLSVVTIVLMCYSGYKIAKKSKANKTLDFHCSACNRDFTVPKTPELERFLRGMPF